MTLGFGALLATLVSFVGMLAHAWAFVALYVGGVALNGAWLYAVRTALRTVCDGQRLQLGDD
eukprot:CAMPEP_0198316490 /NCGR_PEP_ID=MMETSP1450-20131203/6364_1 /TAXON_ID=753684 ORGANISM="Madagascaria erythrocladiodes, Strain CCMP3234" /NCGR_SAMPLE_ID=MMETSP1450 /ASSEMBLY_ACC=CAM_ASM_001115 /LENGTH=61 /DNA_ID=CAMNT_0044019649 /DNA_START=77 /DNA_END=259 /DNA_ORIENTATION=+